MQRKYGFELFDELIEKHQTISYLNERKRGKKFFDRDFFEDAISDHSDNSVSSYDEDYGIKALEMVCDISRRNYYHAYERLFEETIRHEFAHSPSQMRRAAAKTIHATFKTTGIKCVSELLTTAILNHPLVQYFFTENPKDFANISGFILPKDLNVLKIKLPSFFSAVTDKMGYYLPQSPRP